MKNLLSQKNEFYDYSLIKENNDFLKQTQDNLDYVATFFVSKGFLEILIEDKKIKILQHQGIVVSSISEIKNLNLGHDSEVFEITSKKKTNNVIEIIDNKGERSENLIETYKILKNHKIVQKPWGNETWVIWLKDYHVLKKIFMTKGNKCSLQYHDEKYETNYIINGKAKVIKGLHLDLSKNKEENFKKVLNTDLFSNYSMESTIPFVFTNIPGEVHRVYSLEDYTAYEVSTPQLDDVVRIQDDNKRESGLIKTEHH